MLYYLGLTLRDVFTPFNVLTYNTVRAGGAAMTGFLIALLIGPTLIHWLRMLKVGQFIRQEHVADLHALHQKKEGTPTMGGSLIIISTLITMLFWGRFSNRLLLIALGVFVVLGALGFLDDYTKLRRKENQGLSARAKFAGQIIVGLLLGAYLIAYPITPGRTHLTANDIRDWDEAFRVAERLGLDTEDGTINGPFAKQEAILATLNQVIEEGDGKLLAAMDAEQLDNEEIQALLGNPRTELSARETHRLNRLVLETSFPTALASGIPNLHTKLEIPGFKEVFIPLGTLYILFVLLVVVGSSNAVNLTDGLDGLAIGASIISLMAYTAIAYIVSRADWSSYLFLVYVPEAAELTVFGAALLGTGLGFLWFNSHPAEVFMGDTGSLALGGALGTMAILTKQELLLIVVGGLFVMEAGSVILQVASFKLRGKRIFRMTPIHHHFELKGWSETKVTIRFWILAIVFALMSLGALKLR